MFAGSSGTARDGSSVRMSCGGLIKYLNTTKKIVGRTSIHHSVFLRKVCYELYYSSH
jgi:hypothetical protein